MRRLVFTVALLVLAGSAIAKTAGPATAIKPDFDKSKELESIFRDLAYAPNQTSSKIIIDRLWLTWMMAPDAETAEDMNKALRARGGYNFNKALDILDTMIARQPDYPESWNQRSYIHFLKQDYDKSLSDCKRALTLEPRHIGCLSGMARILIRHQKRFKAGKALLERAIKLNPFLYEKVLLKEIPEAEL